MTSTRIPVEVYDFEYAGSEYSFYSCLLGFSIMISWLRIVTYIKFFSGAMSRIVTIVGECIESCLIWFLMIFIVVVAYAQCFYLAFGPDVEGFDSFEASLATICTWVKHVPDLQPTIHNLLPTRSFQGRLNRPVAHQNRPSAKHFVFAGSCPL